MKQAAIYCTDKKDSFESLVGKKKAGIKGQSVQEKRAYDFNRQDTRVEQGRGGEEGGKDQVNHVRGDACRRPEHWNVNLVGVRFSSPSLSEGWGNHFTGWVL